jgi:hypothetical protein
VETAVPSAAAPSGVILVESAEERNAEMQRLLRAPRCAPAHGCASAHACTGAGPAIWRCLAMRINGAAGRLASAGLLTAWLTSSLLLPLPSLPGWPPLHSFLFPCLPYLVNQVF